MSISSSPATGWPTRQTTPSKPICFAPTGPVAGQVQYCLPPLDRCNYGYLRTLLDQHCLWQLQAPPRSGKTTFLRALAAQLTADGYACQYLNAAAQTTLLADLKHWLTAASPPVLLLDNLDALPPAERHDGLRVLDRHWREQERWPAGLVLASAYDLHGADSPLQADLRQVHLADFSREQIAALYAQHAAANGQRLTEAALDWLWMWTEGQPWLVNALGWTACVELPVGGERPPVLTTLQLEPALHHLWQAGQAPLPRLAERLQEPPLVRVLDALLSGAGEAELKGADVAVARGLGLLRATGPVHIAHPYYRELLPRLLIRDTAHSLLRLPSWYSDDRGRLELARVLGDLRVFWRQHAARWLAACPYRQSGPLLLAQAFLHRMLDEYLTHHYDLGWGRHDLLLRRPYRGGLQQAVLVLTGNGSQRVDLTAALAQTATVMQQQDIDEGHLLLFDRQDPIHAQEWRQGRLVEVWSMAV